MESLMFWGDFFILNKQLEIVFVYLTLRLLVTVL